MEYKNNEDGTVSKVETLTVEEITQQIAEHQAIIDGAQASKQSYMEAKDEQMRGHQAAINVLRPALVSAEATIDALIALDAEVTLDPAP